MRFTSIDTVAPTHVLIDLDTGTIVSTSVRLVPVPDADLYEDLLNSDSLAVGYAQEYGQKLYFASDAP